MTVTSPRKPTFTHADYFQAVLKQLHQNPTQASGVFTFDGDVCGPLGDKEVILIAKALAGATHVTKLCVQNTTASAQTLNALIFALSISSATLQSLTLKNAPHATDAALEGLPRLLERKPFLTRICLDGTKVSRSLKKKINREIEKNLALFSQKKIER